MPFASTSLTIFNPLEPGSARSRILVYRTIGPSTRVDAAALLDRIRSRRFRAIRDTETLEISLKILTFILCRRLCSSV